MSAAAINTRRIRLGTGVWCHRPESHRSPPRFASLNRLAPGASFRGRTVHGAALHGVRCDKNPSEGNLHRSRFTPAARRDRRFEWKASHTRSACSSQLDLSHTRSNPAALSAFRPAAHPRHCGPRLGRDRLVSTCSCCHARCIGDSPGLGTIRARAPDLSATSFALVAACSAIVSPSDS